MVDELKLMNYCSWLGPGQPRRKAFLGPLRSFGYAFSSDGLDLFDHSPLAADDGALHSAHIPRRDSARPSQAEVTLLLSRDNKNDFQRVWVDNNDPAVDLTMRGSGCSSTVRGTATPTFTSKFTSRTGSAFVSVMTCLIFVLCSAVTLTLPVVSFEVWLEDLAISSPDAGLLVLAVPSSLTKVEERLGALPLTLC
jgi:hypothetical protein